jgi:hypothetical protein
MEWLANAATTATAITTPLTCCDKVRSSCAAWMKTPSAAEHVTLDTTPLVQCSNDIQSHSVVWDEEAWHYQPPTDWPETVRKERMALYILALDAMNFCFWPTTTVSASTTASLSAPYVYEYEDLASTLTAICQADHAVQQSDYKSVSANFALSAGNLRYMTVATMTALFIEHHAELKVPPNMKARCALWNEVGSVLLEHFDGSAMHFIERANGSAVALVELMIQYFPGFRDYVVPTTVSTTTTGKETQLQDIIKDIPSDGLYFLKRAQICVGDWNASLDLQLSEMDQLTTFADYRVPQLLRHWKILHYSDSLAATIDSGKELAVNSPEELSIRAATVTAVELLVQELNSKQQQRDGEEGIEADKKPWTAVATDWFLWQEGERLQGEGKLQPHHRVRTIYY